MRRYKGKRQAKDFWGDMFMVVTVTWIAFIIFVLAAYKVSGQEVAPNQQVVSAAEEKEYGHIVPTVYELEDQAASGTDSSVDYDNVAMFKVTHYCGCAKCCGKWSQGSESETIGAYGVTLTPYHSIAVDPKLIPLGTVLHDKSGNWYVAEDTGSAIKGNRVDLFVGNHEQALSMGVSEIELYW